MDSERPVVISKVLAAIKERNPIIPGNITPIKANAWLIEEGLLYKDENTGAKLPTASGLLAGIVTQVRENAQGERYIAVLYPSSAYALVEKAILDNVNKEETPTVVGASIGDVKKIPVYLLERTCWRCGKPSIEIPTYINLETQLEPVSYPWDKKSLHREMPEFNSRLHVFTGGGIEYYPISVVGQNPFLDTLLVEQFPDLARNARMRVRETNRMKGYPYLAAHCPHCRSVQGWFPSVYEPVNRIIASQTKLPLVGYLQVQASSMGAEHVAGNTLEKLWSFLPSEPSA